MDIEDIVYNFSVRLVEIVRYFKEEGGGFPLCDMLLDCGVRAGKASFSEGGPECRTCGRHQHQWYSQLSGYRRYPATRSMNTLLEGLRVRCRPARVSRRLWSSSFQQSPITVRTARSTAIEVVWNCLAVSR